MLDITFLLLSIGKFARSDNTTKAGGICGVITAGIAYYIGFSQLLPPREQAPILPLFELQKKATS